MRKLEMYATALLLASISSVALGNWDITNPKPDENIRKGATFATNGTTAQMDQACVVKFYADGTPAILEGSFNAHSPPMAFTWAGEFAPNPTWLLGAHHVRLYEGDGSTLRVSVAVTVVE